MDSYESEIQVIVSNSNNNNNSLIINNNINSYSMPSTTTTSESFANIGGLTQTTATLTPTTLKNIEESFMDIIPPQPRGHPQEARFMPPVVNIAANYASIQVSNDFNNNSSNNSNSNTSDLEFGSDYDSDNSSSQSQWNAFIDRNNSSANSCQLSDNNSNNTSNGYNRTVKPKTRGRSGRKPMRTEKLSPEEEKKRHQRRERNKQAAARCRKRRMDHTNSLLIETDGLEDKRQSLLNEIESLRKQKEELECVLEAHKTNCKLSANKAQQIDIKPIVTNGSVVSMMGHSKTRPTTLSLSGMSYADAMSETGIPIQTPSTGLFLDALSEGGTGLTPILSAGLTPSVVTPSTTTVCGIRLKGNSLPDSPTVKKLVAL